MKTNPPPSKQELDNAMTCVVDILNDRSRDWPLLAEALTHQQRQALRILLRVACLYGQPPAK